MLGNRHHYVRMLDSDRDRAAGALFHILRSKKRRHIPGEERVVAAFQARADALLEEMEMDARAERYLWERQWG